MLCPKPITLTLRGQPVPCGQCIACRINRQRFWTGRILLEWYTWPDSWFVTLTYEDENVPLVYDHEADGCRAVQLTLDPDDTRLWLDRFRKRFGPVRFFLVGEYGDRTNRPHYHVVIFNQPRTTIQERVESTWTAGFVTVSEMNEARARYVARYTVKKLGKTNPQLGLRYPEYARMSRRPPLGAMGLKWISASLTTRRGAEFLAQKGDVPTEFRLEGGRYPIGRYWREWLRAEHGIEAPKQSAEWSDKPEDWDIRLDRARLAAQKAERHVRKKEGI